MIQRTLLAAALSVLFLIGCGGGTANIHQGPMPDGGTFTGVWHSPQYGEMHFVQTGSQVIGRYTKDERRGRVQGTVSGNVLRFEWSERRELVAGRPITTRGRGYFSYSLTSDGDPQVVGEWGHDDANTGGGPWTGVRDRRRRPEVEAVQTEDTESSDESDLTEFDTAGGDSGGGDMGGGSGGDDSLDLGGL